MFSFRFENFLLQCLRPRRFAAPLLFSGCDLRAPRDSLSIFNRLEQTVAGQFSIHRLRARVLHRHVDSARTMPKGDRRCDFVYILSARPSGAGKRFFEIGSPNAKSTQTLREGIVHNKTYPKR